jgi:transaldolase
MSIYLDSAVPEEAQAAVQTGWLYGITTNPTLLAKSGLNPAETYQVLAALPVQEVYYQVSSQNLDRMKHEVRLAEDILGDKLVVKIPPTPAGFRLAAELGPTHKTCLTAIFSPAQALVARQAEATYIAVYVNRATQWVGDGLALTRSLAEVLAGSKTEILAASLKSVEEVVAAYNAGARHLTLPLEILLALTENEHAARAVEMFNQTGAHLG